MQIKTPLGDTDGVCLIDPATGLPYIAANGGGGGGGGAGGGTPIIDNAGMRWLWIYDKETATSTYISFATGLAGVPAFPITPDADTAVQVNNFPATQVVSATALPLPTGAATLTAQTAGNASLTSIDAATGAPSDAPATTDAGTFSLMALFKRSLQNWTSLIARLPASLGAKTSALSLSITPATDSGLATAANQTTQTGHLATLAGRSDRFNAFALLKSEEVGTTTYVQKSDGIGWYVARIVSTDTTADASYAGSGNNVGVSIADAWTNRATLVYGSIADA